VHTITVKKDNSKHALVLNEHESSPEFRDEKDRMVNSDIFLIRHPSIVNSSTGDFLLNHTDVDEKFKDFLERNVRGKDYSKISSGALHTFYNNHVEVGDDESRYIPAVSDFIVKHPNTTHHTLKTMFDDHNTSYAMLLAHKNYNLDDDLKESLDNANHHLGADNKIERLIRNGHLKPHHIDQILNSPKLFERHPDIKAYLPNNKNAEWSSHSIDKFYNDDSLGETYHKAALYHNKNCSLETRKKILTDISKEGFPEHYQDVYSSEHTRHPDIVKHLLSFTDMSDKGAALNIIKTHKLMDKESFEKEASSYLNEGIRNKKIPEDHLFHKGSLFNLVKGLSRNSLHSLNDTLESTYGSSDLANKLKKSIKTHSPNENLNDRYDFIKDKLGDNAFHRNSFSSDTLNELNDKNTIDALSKSDGLTDFYGKPNESSFYGSMGLYLNFKNKPKTFEHVFNKMKEHGADFRYPLDNKTLTPDQLSSVYHNIHHDHRYLDEDTIHKLIVNPEASDTIFDNLHSKKLLNASHYKALYKRDDLHEDMLKKHIDDHMKTIINTPNGKNAISSRKRIEEILSSPSSSDRIAKHFIDNYSTHENSRTSPEGRKYSFDNTYTHIRDINDKIANNKQFSSNIKSNIAGKNLSDTSVAKLLKNKELSSRGLHSIVTNHPTVVRNNYDSIITHPNLSIKSLNHMIDNNLVPEADKNHALRMFQEKAGQQLLPFKGIKK
jgi:hypothetical protein